VRKEKKRKVQHLIIDEGSIDKNMTKKSNDSLLAATARYAEILQPRVDYGKLTNNFIYLGILIRKKSKPRSFIAFRTFLISVPILTVGFLPVSFLCLVAPFLHQ
jgi:hypothetical protein